MLNNNNISENFSSANTNEALQNIASFGDDITGAKKLTIIGNELFFTTQKTS